MALRNLGLRREAGERGVRGFWAASASLATATSGEGRSGFPNPRSMTSRPLRRAAALRSLMVANTYGGNPLMRRNSIVEVYDPGRALLDPGAQPRWCAAAASSSTSTGQPKTAHVAPASRKARTVAASGGEAEGG